MSTYKKFIHAYEVEEKDRSEITFSDSTKIHMYSDPALNGVRLVGVYNDVKLAYDYPTDTDLTVRLPEWEPQATRGWYKFQEISDKPTGTSIKWRVSDGTNDYWYTSGAWTIVSLATDWNTEAEICDNIATFPWTQKKIQFIANLVTTDESVAPKLYGYNLLIYTNIQWYNDILVDSFVPYLRTHFQTIIEHAGQTSSDITSIDFDDNIDFAPEQPLNIVDIDGIFDYYNDPNFQTDLLSSYDSGTNVATLTGTVVSGTTLYILLKVEPEIIINSQHSDYTEVAKTPAIVIESIQVVGNNAKAPLTIVDRGNAEGWKTDYPFFCNLNLTCLLMDPSIRQTFNMMEKCNSIVDLGLGDQQNSLHTKGLDRYFGISHRAESLYNPRPNFTDIKAYTFYLTIHNVYIYTRDIEEAPVVASMEFETGIKQQTGPFDQSKLTNPMDYPAGEWWFTIQHKPVED